MVVLIFAVGLSVLVMSQETTVMSLMNDYYIMLPAKTFNDPKPSKARLANDREIYFMIGDTSYQYEIGKDSPKMLKYNVTFDSKRLLIDESGNRISIEKNGMVHLKNEKTGMTLKVAIDGQAANQIAIDLNRKLAFVGTGPPAQPGRLYVFNTTKPNRLGSRVLPEFVNRFGDRVISIYVDKSNGQVLLTLTEPGNKWSFQQLKPLQTIVCPPPTSSVKDVNKKSLMAAINLAAEQIIDIYESSIPGNSKYLQNEIQKRTVVYTSAGSDRQSSSMDSRFDDEYSDPCTDEVTSLNKKLKIEEEKTEKFQNNYNIISESFQRNDFTVMEGKRSAYTGLTSKVPSAISGKDVNIYECVLKDDLKKLKEAYESVIGFLDNLIKVRNELEGPPKLYPEINPLDMRFNKD